MAAACCGGGNTGKLLGACQHMAALSSIFPNLLSQLYAKLYVAQALDALGKHPEAQAALQEALDMALPDGVLFPFAENYDGCAPCCPEWSPPPQRDDPAPDRGPGPASSTSRWAAFRAPGPSSPPGSGRSTSSSGRASRATASSPRPSTFP